MSVKRVVVQGLAKLPAFSHAVIAGDTIYVSGTMGTRENSMEVVPGGTGPETEQALRNIQSILKECGASLRDILKVGVFLKDLGTFPQMNEAYMKMMGPEVPARITVGRADLALGATVEIDCIAHNPGS